MSGRSAAALVILLVQPGSVQAQPPQLMLNSQLGDFVGQGRQRSLTSDDGVFTVRRNFDNGVNIIFLGTQPGSFWNLDFAAPGDVELVEGVYEAATRFPFQLPAAPGLSVAGDGAGCNTLTGRFEVLEITFGPGEEVRSFAADFEQHCEGFVPALFGSFRFEPGAPVAPTGVHVAGRGSAGATLAWSGGPGADSYTVKRGVTPGRETVLASGITATGFVDTSAANAQKYYYVVCRCRAITTATGSPTLRSSGHRPASGSSPTRG